VGFPVRKGQSYRQRLANAFSALQPRGYVDALTPAPLAPCLSFAGRPRSHETNYEVASTVLAALASLRTLAASVGDTQRAAVDTYTRAFVGPNVKRLGWEPLPAPHETGNSSLLRMLVLRHAAVAGDAYVVAEALARFDAHAAGTSTLQPDLRQTVYATAAARGGAPRYEALLRLYRASADPEDQRIILGALGRTPAPALLRATLALALTPEVRAQDLAATVGAVAANIDVEAAPEPAADGAGGEASPAPGDAHVPVTGAALAWAWGSANWDTLYERFGGGSFLMGDVVGALTSHFTSRADAERVAAFFAAHPAPGTARKLAQSMEGVRSHVWRSALLAAEGGEVLAAIARLVAE
jgi:hypothetical protein